MELLKLFKRPEKFALQSRAAAMQLRVEATVVPKGRGPVEAPLRRQASLPLELAAFRPIRGAQLEQGRQQALVKVFQNIPKPPALVSRLLCPEFVARGASDELVEVLNCDADLVHALLRDLQSPRAVAQRPIAAIEKAVGSLGFEAVRGLSLHHLLMRSFRSELPEQQRVLEATAQSSLLAAEIGLWLAKSMGYADAGALLSGIVLSFVGRLATAAGMPRRLLAQIPSRGYLARAAAEQAVFGLSSAEVGRLLMHHWGLPAAVVDEAAEVDAVLFAPYAAWDTDRAGRLGLSYLAARLGERLAQDPGSSLDEFDLTNDLDPELHHVRAYLQHPVFAAVGKHLGQSALRTHMDRLRLAMLAHEPASACA
jgi:HD-like signal output (HDOD) protein